MDGVRRGSPPNLSDAKSRRPPRPTHRAGTGQVGSGLASPHIRHLSVGESRSTPTRDAVQDEILPYFWPRTPVALLSSEPAHDPTEGVERCPDERDRNDIVFHDPYLVLDVGDEPSVGCGGMAPSADKFSETSSRNTTTDSATTIRRTPLSTLIPQPTRPAK